MKKIIIILLAALFLAGISSCIKEKYTNPMVTNTDPDITPNTTIAAIEAMYNGSPVQFTQGQILEAVVVGDDKSGNLYKQLAIEDSTGGIMLMITAYDLYTTYPVGRRLFIQLQGLYLVSYAGTYEIAASVTGGTYTGISPANLSQYIVPGKWGIITQPKVMSILHFDSFMNSLQSQLIQLNNVEFVAGSRGVPYANAAYELSGSLNIKDCNENQVVVYTSGYANFASALTPSGNGTMICLAGVYAGTTGTTAQLTVRDTTDLMMTGPTCP